MKLITLLAALVCFFAACKKTPASTPTQPVAEVNITDYNNREIQFNQSFAADLNCDGTNDFYIYTLHIGDALLKRVYKRFLFGTGQSTDLPITHNEEVPGLYKGETIRGNAFPGCNWYNIASIQVAQKVITADENWWEGAWKDVFKKYLPLRIHSNEKVYYGWVEVSFDSINEKVILHRAGVSKTADTEVIAGK